MLSNCDHLLFRTIDTCYALVRYMTLFCIELLIILWKPLYLLRNGNNFTAFYGYSTDFVVYHSFSFGISFSTRGQNVIFRCLTYTEYCAILVLM